MKLVAPVLFLFFLTILIVTGPSCANIVPPSGGPRDSLPPQLLKATPAQNTTNFRGKTIELQFDEYLDDLQEISKNLLFTPTMNTNPEVSVRLRTLTIRMRDTLEPNTTYTFNFGNAIRDINEANVLQNFSYRFSTGPVLDSLKLQGHVLLAETDAVDSTLSVFLYRNPDDSAVIKDRPRYIAKLDRNGNFGFENLSPGTYRIYALGDPTGGRRYYSKSQLFAFADSAIVLKGEHPPVELRAYREVTNKPVAIAPKTTASNDRRLKFTTNLSGREQDLLKSFEIDFERPLKYLDSSRLKLQADSVYRNVNYKTTLDSTKRKMILQTQWEGGHEYHLVLDKDFAEDSAGRKLLKTDTLDFVTRKTTDYAAVAIRIRNVDLNKNPVLQFVAGDQVVFSAPVPKGVFNSSLFNPGDYELRVLYDANKNGVWDPGEFFKQKKQPEVVKRIERRVTIKAGRENDFEIAL